MKNSVIVFVVLCGAIACAVVYLNHQKTTLVPAPDAGEASNQTTGQTQSEKIAVPKQEQPQMISQDTDGLAQIPAPIPTAGGTVPVSTNSIGWKVDALLSAKNGAQKHELFQQLLQVGELNQAIAELQQRATDNPNDPEIPTTLGEALLNKVRATLAANGGQNSDEIGILAMQADQDFNDALKIDPQNWEAQFVKAASMENWPANPQVDNDVVQRLSNLIDQQETMTPQPEFVQAYVVLGEEYQKTGQPEKALATWQLGLEKFPNDPALLKKINGQ